MSIVLPLGSSAVCFIISAIAFYNDCLGLGVIFLLVGLLIVVLGLVFGRKSGY